VVQDLLQQAIEQSDLDLDQPSPPSQGPQVVLSPEKFQIRNEEEEEVEEVVNHYLTVFLLLLLLLLLLLFIARL